MRKARDERPISDISLFGTKDHPLHASALPQLIKCGMRATLLSLGVIGDTSGIAADTGSAVHAGAEQWHKTNDLEAALFAVDAALMEFPQADAAKAKKHAAAYCADPRNSAAKCKIVALEESVELVLAGDIYVVGTLDQIREERNGEWYIHDIKTGSLDGWVMLHEYAFQMSAYAVGASQKFKRRVHPGKIIRTATYLMRGVDPYTEPEGVFWELPYSYEDCEMLLESVVRAVRYVRSGNAEFGPGMHCSYCPAQGLSNCIPAYKNLLS